MTFWQTDMGPVTGDKNAAFTQTIKNIPDNTKVIAKIESFLNKEYDGNAYLQIQWHICEGPFKGRKIFQKIHVFDKDSKRKYRALNMFKLLHNMFNVTCKDSPPTDLDLKKFEYESAGIKIQETMPNENGKQYNWVSEIHPVEGFKISTQESITPTAFQDDYGPMPQSALTRNRQHIAQSMIDDDELPF